LITIQQAIDYLHDPIREGLSIKEKLKLHEEAVNMAVKALEKQIRTSNNSEIPNGQDLISRQDAIDILDALCQEHRYRIPGKAETYSSYNEAWQDALGRAENAIGNLPSAQPDYQEVLGWLLSYHTKSFDLHGRYLPHEVISWLINDFTKEFIAERRTDE